MATDLKWRICLCIVTAVLASPIPMGARKILTCDVPDAVKPVDANMIVPLVFYSVTRAEQGGR